MLKRIQKSFLSDQCYGEIRRKLPGVHAYLHTQVLPAVDPGFEHWGVRREPSLQPAREEERVRPRRQWEELKLPPPIYWPTYSSQRGMMSKIKTMIDFIFLGSKIVADGECSYVIKRHLLLGRKAMTNLDKVLKSKDITLPTKIGRASCRERVLVTV